MTGLFVDEHTFLDFSELEARRESGLTREMYAGGGLGGFDPVGWLGLMPDPDPVLRKTGDGASVLRGLLGDDKVISSIQNRKLGTLKKQDYRFEPTAPEGEKASVASTTLCADLSADLEEVDLYNVFSQVLDAPYYGFTPVEILWRAEGGKMRIADLKPRPVEWFKYDAKHNAYFVGASEMTGQPLIDHKVVFARHFPDATNPYGLRLLSRCLWPVAIKKGGIQFWTMLCERFGMPWVIGQVNGDEKKRAEALVQLSAMVQDAVAVVSGGTEVKLHNVEGKGGDLHPALIRYCDRSIARALQGQNLTNEGDSTGTYAESRTSGEALDVYREADEHLVVTFMNNLAMAYRRVNSADALAPFFTFREPEDYTAQAELGKKITEMGAKLKPVFFERRLGLKPDEFYVPGEPGKGDAAELSLGDGDLSPSQGAVDRLCDELLKNAGTDITRNEKLILAAILASESAEEAMERLLELYPSLSTDKLGELMEQGLLSASLFGVHTVDAEGGDDD